MEREEGGQRGGAMERDQGGWPRSGMVEMLAVGPPVAVENTRAARRSTVIVERVCSSQWRTQDFRVGYAHGKKIFG